MTSLVLEKNLLDHRLIILIEQPVDYGPTLFRIFHSWFELDDFDEIVRGSWSQLVVGLVDMNPWCNIPLWHVSQYCPL